MKNMETDADVVQSSLKEEAKGFIPKIASADDIYRLFHLLRYPDDKLFDSSYKRDIGEFEFKKEELFMRYSATRRTSQSSSWKPPQPPTAFSNT